MMAAYIVAAVVALLLAAPTTAIDNGLARTPQMGWVSIGSLSVPLMI